MIQQLLEAGEGSLRFAKSLVVATLGRRPRGVDVRAVDHRAVRGSRAKAEDAMERRQSRADGLSKRNWLGLFLRSGALIALGLVVLSILLYYGSLHYAWFERLVLLCCP